MTSDEMLDAIRDLAGQICRQLADPYIENRQEPAIIDVDTAAKLVSLVQSMDARLSNCGAMPSPWAEGRPE